MSLRAFLTMPHCPEICSVREVGLVHKLRVDGRHSGGVLNQLLGEKNTFNRINFIGFFGGKTHGFEAPNQVRIIPLRKWPDKLADNSQNFVAMWAPQLCLLVCNPI